jgi:osmotically inducible lipoprotein OsmB
MRTILSPVLLLGPLALIGCAGNYAGEGALVGGAVGAGIGAATDGNVGRGAAIGAAAGAVGGALIRKNGRCYRTDRNGYEYQVRC